MINEFHIAGYRGFSEYHLANLGRVNVFVGKNNAGKSSLLEALHLYSAQLDVQVLQSIAARRGEVLVDIESRVPDQLQFDLSHFFLGHKLRRDSSFELRSEKQAFALRVGEYRHAGSQSEMFESDFFREEHSKHDFLSLVATRRSPSEETGTLYDAVVSSAGAMMSPRRSFSRSPVALLKNCFISPDSLDSSALVSMWNQMLVRNGEAKVVDALRILDPSVASIVFLLPEMIGSRYMQRSSMAGIVVGLQNGQKRYPLGSMGDGMKRLLAIALALSCSSGGALFIDEIDAGFHYSVMKDLWRLVVTTAIANNVQVFASTHSLDCLRGLSILSSETFKDKSAVSLYSVNARDSDATYYSTKEIDTIIRNELEVR